MTMTELDAQRLRERQSRALWNDIFRLLSPIAQGKAGRPSTFRAEPMEA